ncbi:MAG TPA: DUF5695 domain-containing protein [Candidatus Acidoferrales bacterium]|nr:DUF5695 domain-containing protein [Candidatus Acidoferrales bacterium]
MHVRTFALLIVAFGISPATLAQQSVANSQFQVRFSTAGVTSLKHVHDKYDTDYIASGEALGDVVIRYRAPGDRDWKLASAARIDGSHPAGSSSATYVIGTSIPTIATSSRAFASVPSPAVFALNDKIVPRNSQDISVPRFVWNGRKGTTEWVEYDFPTQEKVWSAQVYWAEDKNPDALCNLPKSWRVLYRDGANWKEVNASNGYPVVADAFSEAAFQPVTTSALRIEAHLDDNATAGIFQWRINGDAGDKINPTHDLEASETFQLQNDALLWTISLRNNTDHEIEVGDLGLPLEFNTRYVWDKTETYTKRLIRHSFIGGNGSFIFLMRTNSEGPYLVMTPLPGTGLEYFDFSRASRGYGAYIHSAASAEELRAKGGNWRLPNTRLILAPKGHAGDSAKYGFRFRWAPDYAGVRQVLYQEGLFDVNVVPGMTVPTDLPAMFSLHTRNKIRAVVPEHPESTQIEYLGERGKDVRVYRVHFSHLGENLLNVEYGKGEYLSLEFFVTQPLETLFQKRASFIVTHEQHRDPSKWYNGLFSQWDMKHEILRSPDDLDGLQSYAVACDDPILGKAMYVAGENVFYPSQPEISAVEYYIKNYVWGGLQETDKEEYPYAIYGIPNWKVNRDSPEDTVRGKKHVWRIYDYPHVIAMYYYMYQVAKFYPSTTKYLNDDGYLERAFGTAKAFFTVPDELIKWSADKTGTYDELVIPALIQALYDAGHKDQADWLRNAWEKKVEYFINGHPYLFGSEYPFDSTGFESTEAFARYAMHHVNTSGDSTAPDSPATDFSRAVKYTDAAEFLDEQMKLNIACRGWLETAYYDLGSDYRASGNASYTLSYMAQMGGWAVMDYALNFAKDSATYMRLGFASYLSSWALLNSGTPESNYGYWYPGKNNDGGASGGFEPRPWGRAWLGNKEMGRGPWWYSGEIDLGFTGALRTAATVVVDDPIFGLFAYGGDLKNKNGLMQVVPKDGLRTRFHILRGAQRVHILLGRDGFAKGEPVSFDDSLHRINFTLENRAATSHHTAINISGLPPGNYQVTLGRRLLQKFTSKLGEGNQLLIPMDDDKISVELTKLPSTAK